MDTPIQIIYIQQLQETNSGNEKERARLVNELSRLRSGVSDATDAMKGAASGIGGKKDDGDKEERNEEEKKEKDEIDRYWELNKAIESVTEYVTSFWNSLSTFMGLVTKFFNTLPIEIRAVCITFFTTACTLGLLKILKHQEGV